MTAAFNEERHIGETLASVAAQSLRPKAWVIVNDGSTDRTREIIASWLPRLDFLRTINVSRAEKHDFASKVHALRRAVESLKDESYDFIGVLDADVEFSGDYFERLFSYFDANPRLGIAGGDVLQLVDGVIVPRIKDSNTVAGAVQMIRRECFEQTGGIPVLRHGGEDAALEICARMHGWETRTIRQLPVTHFGLVGTAAGGRTRARFKWGRMNYSLGYHPLYQLARATYRLRESPLVLGSLAELCGFAVGKLRDGAPSVNPSVASFLKQEQLAKLRKPLQALRQR